MMKRLISMYKNLRLILMILVAVTIISFIIYQLFNSLENKNNWAERNRRYDRYEEVLEALEFNDLNEQTIAKIQEYRELVGSNSNFIVTDDSGKIIYQANDGYIPDRDYFIVLINPHLGYTRDAYIVDAEKNVKYVLEFDSVYNSTRLVQFSKAFAANQNFFEESIKDPWYSGWSEKRMNYAYIGSKGWNVYSIQDLFRGYYKNYDPIQYWSNIIGCVSFVIFWLILPIWTFTDAKKRNYKPALWGILTLVTNVIALIIYLLTRPEISICQGCGELLNDKHIVCPLCGTPNRDICKSCKKIIEKNWIACPYCGQKVECSEIAACNVETGA